MYEIRLLNETNITEITNCYNQVFTDYVIPKPNNSSDLMQLFKELGVDFSFSFGVFISGKLIGFMINAVDDMFVFDIATGVIPEYRGQNIAKYLFTYAKEYLTKHQFQYYKMEICELNTSGIKLYKSLELEESRNLKCFKGNISHLRNATNTNNYLVDISFQKKQPNVIKSLLDEVHIENIPRSTNFTYSWGNNLKGLHSNAQKYDVYITRTRRDNISGYCIINKDTGEIKQFSISNTWFRNRTALALFTRISYDHNDIIVNNIDSEDLWTLSFLKSIQMQNYTNFLELELKIC